MRAREVAELASVLGYPKPRQPRRTVVSTEPEPATSEPMPSTLSPRELHQSGLLYHLNETALWPLGLALSVEFDKETGEYGPNIAIQNFGEVVQDPSPEIRAKANQWLAERFGTVRP